MTRKSWPEKFLENLNSTTVIFDDPLPQFGLARAALLQLTVLQSFDLVLVTRDDFVYSDDAWAVIATKFDPRPQRINLVSMGCMKFSWDGLHLFYGVQAPLYADAFARDGKWAHLLQIPDFEKSFFFDSYYSQPDRCHPPLGFLDRSDQHDGQWWLPPDPCCANHTLEIHNLKPFRRCPRVVLPQDSSP